MNPKLSIAARAIVLELLEQCTEKQQEMFKLMYGRGINKKNRDGCERTVDEAKAMDISECVSLMDEEKLDWAISQCEATIYKNNQSANSNN